MTDAEQLTELCGLSGEVQPDGELVEVEEDELEMRMRSRLRYRAGGICCSGCSFGGCNIKVCSGTCPLLDQMSQTQLEEEQTQPSPLHGAQQTPEASSQAPEGFISSQKIRFGPSRCHTHGVRQRAPRSSSAWSRFNMSTS